MCKGRGECGGRGDDGDGRRGGDDVGRDVLNLSIIGW